MTITEFLMARFAEDQAHAEQLAEAYEQDEVMVPAHLINLRALAVPRRMEAEAKAKLALLYLSLTGCGDDHERVQRALALPYADHPEYRASWRVD